jgi:membrane associated rhomboid family serine protease
MSFSQIMTDRVLPVLTAATLAGAVYFTVLLATKGSVGGAISTGALAALFGVIVLHDVKRLILKK